MVSDGRKGRQLAKYDQLLNLAHLGLGQTGAKNLPKAETMLANRRSLDRDKRKLSRPTLGQTITEPRADNCTLDP